MASEDHDFDEIDHFRFNGKKYQWKTDQTGAVGRFDLSTIQEFIKSVPGAPDFFIDAYKGGDLAAAVRKYMNHLFGEYGLVVIDGDDRSLKTIFTKVAKDDLTSHLAQKLVNPRTNEINALGYKTQVTSREVNLFYLDKNVREAYRKS